jgi:hypothetical protein
MGHSCAADKGDNIQIWRVTVNILINSSTQLIRGGPPAWGLGKGLTIPCCKELVCYEMLLRALYMVGFFGTT